MIFGHVLEKAMMQRFNRVGPALLALSLTTACAGGAAIQPDRAIFSLDNNYQRHAYAMPIEQTFEKTIAVFKEAGYQLDVIDRATGQLSGRRGAAGDKGSSNDKDLKFYALILPKGDGSELGIKIIQVLKSGALGASKAELIVNDPQMYQYLFKRIENVGQQPFASFPHPIAPSESGSPASQ